jgi:hypothetical protein
MFSGGYPFANTAASSNQASPYNQAAFPRLRHDFTAAAAATAGHAYHTASPI